MPDGTIYRALEKLLVLDGERISYRALDVEQIGSVYETMMGFRLETATGRSVAIKAQKKQGAPTAVDLEALLARSPRQAREVAPGPRRPEAHRQGQESRGQGGRDGRGPARGAATCDRPRGDARPRADGRDGAPAERGAAPLGLALHAARAHRADRAHHARADPRALRGEDGRPPRPEQILDLKVCDPAMGSGAFLVEACRQLGDALVEAWHAHGERPEIPPDEDEVIFARRLVAQRCLYGVDRNPVAVDLAKMSLWLVTLARDHALTFVDHALRHGDSLVGLSRQQIEAFHWEPSSVQRASRRCGSASTSRGSPICVSRSARPTRHLRLELRDLWDEAQSELGRCGSSATSWSRRSSRGRRAEEREAKRAEYANAVVSGEAERYRGLARGAARCRAAARAVPLGDRVPEVFDRENAGFDAIVGNPPFAGKNTIASANPKRLPRLAQGVHEEATATPTWSHISSGALQLAADDGTFG